MDELVEITFDTEPFDLDREPDARLVAPADGWYAVRVGADGAAELVPVDKYMTSGGGPLELDPAVTVDWRP
jgi:hypothetical protein